MAWETESGSWDYQSLNKHNFLKTCPIGASDVSIDIYAKSRCLQLRCTLLRTSPWGLPATPWSQGGPESNTRNLWRGWWEGPTDPNVGYGLPILMETRNHKNEAMSYE